MDHYRRLSHITVAAVGEFHFQVGAKGEGGFLGWRVLTFHDQYVIYSLSPMEERLKHRLRKTDVQVRLIEGGQFHRPEDFLLEGRSVRPEPRL